MLSFRKIILVFVSIVSQTEIQFEIQLIRPLNDIKVHGFHFQCITKSMNLEIPTAFFVSFI